MSTKPPDWQEQLQASLRRAQDAIEKGVHQQQQIFQTSMESLRQSYPNWGEERWQRKLEKKLRKQAEAEARIQNATLLEGYLWALGAIALFIVALTSLGTLWWLLFPAVPLFQRGTRVVARYMKGQGTQGGQTTPVQQPQLQTPPLQTPPVYAQRAPVLQQQPLPQQAFVAPRPAEDARDLRVDAICERLLAELRTAPESAREIFRNPEATVQSLRATCRDLTRRERELRSFLSPSEDTRLTREREALAARVEAETDEVAKLRLASALAALDQQRQQRAELAKSANRFEAEHTRIGYTLESLHTQVMRMRSADAASVDVAGAGLRQSLDNLSKEVDALADALEKVNRGDEQRLRGMSDGPSIESGSTGAGPGARQKV